MQVTEKLEKYYHYYQDLKKNGGPEENTDLFEAVIELEEEIMAAYGLPPSHHHLQILWQFTEAPSFSEEVVQEAQQHLQQAATEHLMAPVKTNLEVLQEAQQEKHSAFNVLPEIGQPTHDYPIFLYEELLLKGKSSAEEVLQEMEKVKELDCYGEVATLLYKHRKSFKKTKIYKHLKPHLHFLDTYLQQLRALGESEESSSFISSLVPEERILSKLKKEEDSKSGLAPEGGIDPTSYNPTSVLLTGTIEIEEVVFARDTAVTVNGLWHTDPGPKPISLGFDKETLQTLLSRYEDRGEFLLHSLQLEEIELDPEEPVVINLKDSTGSTFLLNQHYLKGYKPLVLGEDGTHEVMQDEFYLVEEVLDKSAYDSELVKTSQTALNVIFLQTRDKYEAYLTHLQQEKDEKKARQLSGLGNPVLFELARHLYLLQKHSGPADLS